MSAAHAYTERVHAGEPGFEAHLARYQRAGAELPAGIDVLDAGSGAGFGAALLADGGRRVTGVDASADVVEQAAREFPQVQFVTGDLLALPFADESFDAVTCFEVIEHVDDPAAAARELARVLRPGGVLMLSTPHARMELLHARSAGRGGNPHHVTELTPRTLRRLLRRDFAEVTLYGQTEDRGALHAALKALDPFGLRLRISPQRRAGVHRALATGEPPASTPYRFSRLLAHSAAITVADARKPGP